MDILKEPLIGVVSVLLQGSDGSRNHRIALYNNWLFDSNCDNAYPLCKTMLDWCVDGHNTGVKFSRVWYAYAMLENDIGCGKGKRRRARMLKKEK